MQRHVRIRLLLLAGVALIAGAVWLAGERQRVAADRAFGEIEAAETMLVAMLDKEGALGAYVDTRRPEHLERYDGGRSRFELAVQTAKTGAPRKERDEIEAIAAQVASARRWSAAAEPLLAAVRAGELRTVPREEAAALRREMSRFRSLNADFKRELRTERDDNQSSAGALAVGLIVLLTSLFGGGGYLFFERRSRRDEARHESQSGFTEVLQLARTEAEAYQIVKRHLERLIPGGVATVLNRNNSANRLVASSVVDDDALALSLEGAEPEACLAIRGGKAYARSHGDNPLISCEICGAMGENVTCVPSLVGGEVIGSVLVQHPRRLARTDVDFLSNSIAESSPILANLRNLAIAELRAATDALTGLPNNRALQETLKRMSAQAGRTASSLAVLLFDLDHFKQINDNHGHGKGDEVLAAVGDVVASKVRASDVAGRYGGEEFMALLPDTDRAGALRVAETLRAAIGAIAVPGVALDVSASFGVAVLPDEAGEPEELIRVADRALYTAKANGRNRVEVCDEAAAFNGSVATAPSAAASQ